MKSWNTYFANMALLVSSRSEDTSTKCGAVIVSKDNSVLSTGYNGFPRGIRDTKERQERPIKYLFFEHGERNAIYNAARFGISTLGTTMYVTGIPCADCARGIIQAGIIKVVMLQGVHSKEFEERWKESTEFSLNLFKEAKIHVEYYSI